MDKINFLKKNYKILSLIWGLTAWLVHEAINKILKEDTEINATVMLITAGVGLLCNISMGHILHSSVKNILLRL